MTTAIRLHLDNNGQIVTCVDYLIIDLIIVGSCTCNDFVCKNYYI